MSSVISVEGVSKSYRLGMIGGATLKEDVSRWWAKLRGAEDPLSKVGERHARRKMGDVFWALDDVSFKVDSGEALGIIGRNGAGKSTLLKILSQVTAPTSGEIKIKGRIASLLEVGTGFHPELSGRENIFLNGAILGMSRAEIRRKFDEIVAFSGVEEFVDTPVKRYSSGMYVRLAFAIAAHLEPEILVIDEVLAVGDAEFQRKCLGKMEDVTGEGRTVLFVSHNMAAMQSLCRSGLLLEDGQLKSIGTMESASEAYFADRTINRAEICWPADKAPRNESIIFHRAFLQNKDGCIASMVDCSDGFSISLDYEILRPVRNLRIGIVMETSGGLHLCGSNDEEISHGTTVQPGRYRAECIFPAYVLNAGSYLIQWGADSPTVMPLMLAKEHLAVDVEDTAGHGPNHIKLPGVIRPRLKWTSKIVPCVTAPVSE